VDDGRASATFARVKLIIASRKLIIRKFVNGGDGGGRQLCGTNGSQIIDGRSVIANGFARS